MAGERSPDRRVQRNGYRERDWHTRAGAVELQKPRLRKGSYFASDFNHFEIGSRLEP